MTPWPPDDAPIDYLFARYWDDALSPSERAELEDRLAADPLARAAFNRNLAFAVAAADRPPLTPPVVPRRPAGMTRRRALGYLGAGLAGGAAGAMVLHRPDPPVPAPPATAEASAWLTEVSGRVTLAPNGRAAVAGLALFTGTVISSLGLGSGAELRFSDGTRVGLNADSSAVLTGATGLALQSGTASADIAPPAGAARAFTLTTAEAAVIAPLGATVAVGRTADRATEIGVEQGRATVTAGADATDLHGGEFLTVRGNGQWRKEPMPAGAEAYAWDLTRPLPDGWVGTREKVGGGFVARPDLWYDAYHAAEMYQIRTDSRWTRGFCRVWPDSRVRVRYKVDRPGQGQVVLVVRPYRGGTKGGGVLEMNAAFDRADPGAWTTFDAPAAALLANRHAPAAGPPWVLFHAILNTFEADLGLCVADFRVTRPGTRRTG